MTCLLIPLDARQRSIALPLDLAPGRHSARAAGTPPIRRRTGMSPRSVASEDRSIESNEANMRK